MFYLYLFSAVAGCLLVGVSMAGIGSSDGDGGDAHALGDGQDGGHALGDGQHGDAQHGDGARAGGGHGAALHGLGAAASMLFSLQLWTYLLAFGGLTGLLLRTLAHVGEPAALLCSLGVGLGTGVVARKVLRRMTAIGDSGTVEPDKLVGTSAQVLIPAEAGMTGKIRLAARGQMLDLLARAADGKSLIAGADVVIVDMKDGVAEVTSELPELHATPDRQAIAAQSALSAAPPSTTKG